MAVTRIDAGAATAPASFSILRVLSRSADVQVVGTTACRRIAVVADEKAGEWCAVVGQHKGQAVGIDFAVGQAEASVPGGQVGTVPRPAVIGARYPRPEALFESVKIAQGDDRLSVHQGDDSFLVFGPGAVRTLSALVFY
jgi:hypothetical protein